MIRMIRVLMFLTLSAAFLGTVSAQEIYVDGQIVIELNPGFTIEEVNATWGTTTIDVYPEAGLYLVFIEGVPDLEAFALQMMTDPAVLAAEPNFFEDTPEGVRQMVIVAVGGEWVDYEDQQITERIGLDEAHRRTRGIGVTVGVLDTGIDPNHPVFQGRIAPGGYDFVDLDDQPWEEANGADDDGDGDVDDGYGHGTMVAGIVALVAPDAKILPIRVLDDEGRGTAWQIARGIRYAIDQGADVLNMSFGVPRTISTIGHELYYADSMAVPVVAGAGNENTDDHVYYPAASSKAMMITALDSLDIKADFADWKSKVHVSAPGTGVRSAYPGGDWGLGSGCSFATPFVTGEVALILSLAPGMSIADIEDRVEAAVDPIYHLPGNDPYDGKLGSGRIFVPEALYGLVASAPSTPSFDTRAFAIPNPASGSVRFRLPGGSDGAAGLICDVSGRTVRTIEAGDGPLVWDGRDALGRRVAPGVYYARVTVGAVEHRVPIRVVR